MSLANVVSSLPEDTAIGSAVKVADIVVSDDGLGTNDLTLSGVDAALFEIVGTELYLKAGTVLDYDVITSYSIHYTKLYDLRRNI